MSKALAIHSVKTQGSASVFLPEQEWKNCSGPFQKERNVSAKNCHFDGLYYGSSACSNTTLASIKKEQAFQNAISNCSNLSNAFEDVCGNCSKAVLDLRDDLLEAYEVKDGNATETGICGMAAVISVLEEKMNNTFSIDNDYMFCMSLLDTFDSLAEAILSILIGITAVTLIILLIKFVTKKQPQKPVHSGPITTWSGLYRFSKAEIENAINTERKDLGRGSAGQVYKGVLPSGQVVAIKHINKSNTSDSFTREVEGLSRIRHPNLVCLFGCCVEDGEQYLVYEYCAKGNLAQHLLSDDPVLTWERRVKILRDCALALRYLHHYIDGCIVHRDIKLTNILLTDNLEPKLSDFGLAKMLGMEETKVFTDVRGTIGYMDPEYMTNAKLTCASDVYSFGIVALQLLSGQKVFELDLDARDQLTRKAKDISMNKRPPEDLEDPRLNGNVNKADFESILQVAVLCVAKSSKGRPTIGLVFEEMDKAWKNTLADMKARNKGISSSATPLSMSSDFLNTEQLAFLFGLLGNIVSFMTFLAPIPTFYTIYKKKSSKGFQSIPYVIALLSATLLLYYGVLKTNAYLIISINSIGIVIEVTYLILYIVYASKNDKITTLIWILLVNVAALGLVLAVTFFLLGGTVRISAVGWICAVFNIAVFAAPLSIMNYSNHCHLTWIYIPAEASNKNQKCGIHAIFFVLFPDTLCHHVLPNVLGFLFGIAQMTLYMTYKTSGNNVEEKKSTQEMKKLSSTNRPKLVRSVSEYPRSDKLNQITYVYEANDEHHLSRSIYRQ
ncbi:hypothetical protein DVH24_036876 [Malus domestica]|uniref:Protein kinase domain-containing protein n=1 Tax=Malus domestica TaxID=3750 RepID=A0A498IK68_MALDO|nr:hypothetical protein DVH24_036876 [Malus domestica]